MRKEVIFVFCLINIIICQENLSQNPEFELIEDRSANGTPIVSITFFDGYKDTLLLSRYYANEQDRISKIEDCNYIGHLENEPSVGCNFF